MCLTQRHNGVVFYVASIRKINNKWRQKSPFALYLYIIIINYEKNQLQESACHILHRSPRTRGGGRLGIHGRRGHVAIAAGESGARLWRGGDDLCRADTENIRVGACAGRGEYSGD